MQMPRFKNFCVNFSYIALEIHRTAVIGLFTVSLIYLFIALFHFKLLTVTFIDIIIVFQYPL